MNAHHHAITLASFFAQRSELRTVKFAILIVVQSSPTVEEQNILEKQTGLLCYRNPGQGIQDRSRLVELTPITQQWEIIDHIICESNASTHGYCQGMRACMQKGPIYHGS
jgi:hypothetical protein